MRQMFEPVNVQPARTAIKSMSFLGKCFYIVYISVFHNMSCTAVWATYNYSMSYCYIISATYIYSMNYEGALHQYYII